MSKSIRCFGYVLAGIGIMAALTLVGFACIGGLFWLADATNRYFDLPDKYGALFLVAYMVMSGGGIVGAVICRDAQ